MRREEKKRARMRREEKSRERKEKSVQMRECADGWGSNDMGSRGGGTVWFYRILVNCRQHTQSESALELRTCGMQQKSIHTKPFARISCHCFAVTTLFPPDPSWYFQSPSTRSMSPFERRLKTD